MQPILLPCQAPFIINLRKTSVRVSCMQRTRKFRKLLLNGAWYELWHKDWLLCSVPLSFNLIHHSLFSGIIFQNIFPSKAWQKDIHRSLLWVPRFGLSAQAFPKAFPLSGTLRINLRWIWWWMNTTYLWNNAEQVRKTCRSMRNRAVLFGYRLQVMEFRKENRWVIGIPNIIIGTNIRDVFRCKETNALKLERDYCKNIW